MTAIVMGIMLQEKIRERVLAIARGTCKPKPGEPKIWFTSMKSLAEVLSDDNRALLQAIREVTPESVIERPRRASCQDHPPNIAPRSTATIPAPQALLALACRQQGEERLFGLHYRRGSGRHASRAISGSPSAKGWNCRDRRARPGQRSSKQ